MRDLVYMTYLRCPVQKVAVRRVIQEVQRGRLMWSHSTASQVHRKQIIPSSMEFSIWSTFMAEMIVQLKVFGYAVYRVARIRGRKGRLSQYKNETTENIEDTARLEVANGQALNLQWNSKILEWEVFSDEDSDLSLTKKDWHVIFLHRPYKVGNHNVPVLASGAASCQKESALYLSLKSRIEERDRINTNPCVYTTVSKNLTTTGQSTKPWFTSSFGDGAGSSHITVPGFGQDFGSLLNDRLETLRDLDKLSKAARESTRKAYESSRRPQLHTIHEEAHEPEADALEATEMFISDGRDAREMSFRQGPPEVHQLMDRLAKEIYFSHDVTPQSSGMSGSSERLTSNDRLAQIAIDVTSHHIVQIRLLLQRAMTKLSAQLSGDDSGRTYVEILPCISEHNLRQVESILKTDALIDAYTCLMDGLPHNSIDRDAIERRKENMLAGKEKPAKEEPRMTEEQKTARRNKQAIE